MHLQDFFFLILSFSTISVRQRSGSLGPVPQDNLSQERSRWVTVIEIVIKDAAQGFNLMSHSGIRLPLDPVSWREVLIRAAGTNGREKNAAGWKNRGKRNKSLIHQWPLCAVVQPVCLYQSTSNRCLERTALSCFTQERRSARLRAASVTHLRGADLTGGSSFRTRATLTLLTVSLLQCCPVWLYEVFQEHSVM